MSTSRDNMYDVINRILESAEEITDLIDRLEIELLRPELEERLHEDDVPIEDLGDLKKLIEENC